MKNHRKRNCPARLLTGIFLSILSAGSLWAQTYELVWADEFDRNGKPDPASWSYEKGFVRNRELQCYGEDNAVCRDGVLVIEARRDKDNNYTSSSIKTQGKREFLYGRFEIKARIPIGGGAWPAIWTLGKSMEWPSNGEIDLMEYYRIKGVPHILANAAWGTEQRYNAKWNTKAIPFSYFTDKDPDWASKFHVWRMDWDETAIRLYLDDELLNETRLSETINGSLGQFANPFKQPHYLLLNLAIGGINGGEPDISAFPMRYEIDYVRVYQKKGLVPVASGYSETSVNTTIFRANSLAAHQDTQYIAFYDPEGYLTLGKRALDTGCWQLERSPYQGNCADAHNVISLMPDGDGYVHVAFDHHNGPLRYARSTAPGSLTLGALTSMTGTDENKVTYPEFYRLADGDLLFAYRSGSSGRGNLVLNRYRVKTKQWERVQDVLVDGENQRNAYWQLCTDPAGTLHLSWVWRESWLVETNHDLCYARSRDGGQTWEKSTGEKYTLPITAANAEYACRIAQNHELMNQTSMTADAAGRPYIAAYWRNPGEPVPQYRMVFHDGAGWRQQQVSHRLTPFTLSGGGTKSVPMSRPRMVVKQEANRLEVYYLFRDEERGNKVSLACSARFPDGEWNITDLTDFSVGAWEPSHDTELWKNRQQLHLYVQKTGQGDGERKVSLPAQTVYVREVNTDEVKKGTSAAVNEVIDIIHKVNRYWQSRHPVHENSFWHRAAYHTGNLEAYFLTGDPAYRAYSESWAERNEWKGAKSNDKSRWKYTYGETDDYVLFGDYQICFQVYADLYALAPEEKKIARAREVMEYQMNTPFNGYWWWADGLYMVMPVMTKLHRLTGNRLYLDKLHEYLSVADSIMYDSETGLYYRDAKYVYPKHKSVNGKKDFWARGDGWVLAGLAKVLKDLPEDDVHRPAYIRKFRKMAQAVAACQQPEGYWTRSMLDPEHAPGPETSGTAFFAYGLLWGINNGLLSKEEYGPVAEKAWIYLSTRAMQSDGKVGYVQPIGEKAIPGQVVNADSQADFGVGAFLLAACERVRYLR